MLRALKKKEEERVGKAIFNSFCKLACTRRRGSMKQLSTLYSVRKVQVAPAKKIEVNAS